MGIKERDFRPLPDDLSLEILVPKDNFYRRLEERIDLSFVRELVLPLYANGGRHSIDPVVFFKLQLVLFFENLRSERQLMEVVADRLSLRWYVGYDLYEPLPDHSSLTKIRERYGLEVFRTFFERIIEMCVEAGLVRGKELFFDSTKIEADAAVDSLAPRWFVEAHLSDLFEEADVRHQKDAEDLQEMEDARFGDVRDLFTSCLRLKTKISSGATPQAKIGSPVAAPRTAHSKGPPGASGPPTPGLRGPTLTQPP